MTIPLEILPTTAAALRSLRLLVVVAHPDDEVLGCGLLLSRAARVRVIHVTDGAPRDGADAHRQGHPSPTAYAAARRAEAVTALALAGHPAACVETFDIPDQEASLHLPALARRLAGALQDCDVVLTHAYEGGHPDHDAVAFAAHAACRSRAAARPALFEMPFYHAGEPGWVRQSWLPHPDAGPETVIALDPVEQAVKRRMIDAHASQAGTLGGFALDAERFRRAPPTDFARLPHAGPLLYERHGWNLTGSQWLARTAAALDDLGMAGPCA